MSRLRDLWRRRGEARGEMSLAGLIVSASIFVVVTGGTVTTFDSFSDGRQELESRTEAQDQARTAVDRLSRELRNLASPTPAQPQAVDLASPLDLVFKTVDPNGPNNGLNAPNIKRVRYCFDAANARLHAQTQTWATVAPPAAPSTAACPASGWDRTETLATNVRNGTRPIFTVDSATLTAITTVHVDLWVDADPGRGALETKLSSGVFLRNQNRTPIAAFNATATAQGIVLNGSASRDPEGEPLTYVWYDGATKIGNGITFTYVVPAGTSHTIRLEVFDPAALMGSSPSQVVVA